MTAESTPPLIAATTLLPPVFRSPVPSRSISPAVAVPVVLEGLVQRVEDERERVLLARGKRPAKGLFDVRLGDAGRFEQVPAIDQLREGRASRDARRAAVDLVANLVDDVTRDTDRETGDVAARRVAGLAPAGGVRDLAGVARPDEVVHDLWCVTVRHGFPAFSPRRAGRVPVVAPPPSRRPRGSHRPLPRCCLCRP